MIGKILKINDELAISLDPEIVKKLKLTENTKINISAESETIIIKIIKPKNNIKKSNEKKVSDRKKVQEAYQKAKKQYAPALAKLAKN